MEEGIKGRGRRTNTKEGRNNRRKGEKREKGKRLQEERKI